MNHKLFNFSQSYRNALRTHLKQEQKATLKVANKLGCQAASAGFQTLDLAKFHEETVVTELLPVCPALQRAELIHQAGIFFTETILALQQTDPSEQTASSPINKIIETLSQRMVELAASNLKLSQEIAQSRITEESHKKKATHCGELLKQARRLSHQILSAQEVERKKTSKDIHDVIVQTLAGINLRLSILKKEAKLNLKGFQHKISSTQRLINQSVKRVHRFALELHPTVLDDLGLIPALDSLLKNFTDQTGILTRLTVCDGVEHLPSTQRTIFFRVAQESLTYVASLTKASYVEVEIQKLQDCICMKIMTDGKSVKAISALNRKGVNRIELLRIRERLEMIGGDFEIEFTEDHGILLIARIPTRKGKSSIQSI